MVRQCLYSIFLGQDVVIHKMIIDMMEETEQPVNQMETKNPLLSIKNQLLLVHCYVYKVEYKKGTGSFTDISMVDFTSEIKAMGIGLGSFAYGFPALFLVQ